MKRITFIIASSLILAVSSIGQSVSVTSSPEMVNNTSTAFWKSFLGETSEGYFVLRKGGPISNEEILIENYDKSFNLQSTSQIPGAMGIMGDGQLHRKTLFNNGTIYSFFEGWSKAQGENSLIVYKHAADGSFPDENGFVIEAEPSKSQMKSANYQYSFSPDGSKMLVLTCKPFEKGGQEEIRLQVFNTLDFTSIWKGDYSLKNESKKFPNNYSIVNNAGVAFLFKDIKISGKEHVYQLHSANGKDLSTEELDLKGNYPTYHSIMIDSNDEMVLVAMLANLGQSRGVWQSTMYTRANSLGAIVSHIVSPLGESVLKDVVSEKNAKKPEFKLKDFVLKGTELNSAGEVLLISEIQKSSKVAVGEAQPPVYNHTLSYEGILVLNFDKGGNKKWSTFYNKSQSVNTLDEQVSYGSFAYTLKNDRLAMIWNYTAFYREPIKGFRYWKDINGAKINLDNIIGDEAMYPTLLTVIGEKGVIENQDKTLQSVLLGDIQKPNAYLMAVDPSISFMTDNGLLILSRMQGKSAKRYKFNTIKF